MPTNAPAAGLQGPEVPPQLAGAEGRSVIDAELALPVTHAHDAVALTVSEDPKIAEAVAHLHPLLREALQHELARSDLSIQTAPKAGFSRQASLLGAIEDINRALDMLWKTQVTRKRVWWRFGQVTI